MSEWLSLCSKIKDKYYFFLQNPGCFTVCRITVTIRLHVKAFWNVSRVQKDCKDLRWEIVNAKNTRQIRSADQKTAWLGPPATHGLTPASPWRHPSASLYPRPSDLPTGSLVHQAFAATTPVSVLCPHDWLLRPPFACKLKEAELALWLVCAQDLAWCLAQSSCSMHICWAHCIGLKLSNGGPCGWWQLVQACLAEEVSKAEIQAGCHVGLGLQPF